MEDFQLTHLEDVRNGVREGMYLNRVFFFFLIHFDEIVKDNNLWDTCHFIFIRVIVCQKPVCLVSRVNLLET